MLWLSAAALAVALVSPLVALSLGHRIFVVTSGSMRPAAEAGDAILLQRVDADRIQVGDVVTFRPLRDGGIRTHRVMSLHDVDGVKHLRTKGDYNGSFDPDLVPATNALGRARMVLPWIGRGYIWTTTVWARVILVAIPALAIAAREARWLLRLLSNARPRRRRRVVPRHVLPFALAMIALMSISKPSAGLFGAQAGNGSNTIATSQVLPPTSLDGSAQLDPCQVNLSWAAPTAETAPDGYDILRSTSSGGPYSLRKHVGAVTSAADDSAPLAPVTTYYYVVRSTRGGWTSANSSERSITTLDCSV